MTRPPHGLDGRLGIVPPEHRKPQVVCASQVRVGERIKRSLDLRTTNSRPSAPARFESGLHFALVGQFKFLEACASTYPQDFVVVDARLGCAPEFNRQSAEKPGNVRNGPILRR